jgi:hypothetical protein
MSGPEAASLATPPVLRKVETPAAFALAALAATLDDLQMVLQCCERLMVELAPRPAGPDIIAVEALWTTALTSYTRCFSAAGSGAGLTEDDVRATHAEADVLSWHSILMHLRDHYADPTTNPREQFSVGVAQDQSGAASGIGITSARQPLVDDVTVRQTGAVAYALSAVVDERIVALQTTVFSQMERLPKADLDQMVELEVAQPTGGQ